MSKINISLRAAFMLEYGPWVRGGGTGGREPGRIEGGRGTGGGRVRYGRREVLTPLPPPTPGVEGFAGCSRRLQTGVSCLVKTLLKIHFSSFSEDNR